MGHGIAAKVLGGLALAMGVLLFAIWFSFDRFVFFDARFEEISRHRLPTLFKVSELESAATELASLSADVLYPKGHYLFFNTRTLIEQTQDRARATVAGIEGGGQVINAFQGVGDAFLDLVAMREEQLAIRSRIDRIFTRLGAIEMELAKAVDGHGAASWIPQALEASAHFFVIRSLDFPEKIRAHQHGFEEVFLAAESTLASLPQAESRSAMLTLRELRDYGLGERNLFQLQMRDVELTRLIQRKIYDGKHRMAQLNEEIRALHNATRQTMEQEEQQIQAELERLRWLLGLVAVVALLALTAIFLYVRRSVVARILRLHRAMQANMGDQPTPVPVQGNDELSLMARQVNHFIDEINRREAELKTSAHEAQAANRAKDEFLANISHEIRTPMNAILNLTRICLQDPLAARQRERLSKVERSSGYLLELINEILDFSRITAGRIEFEPVAFRLQQLLESVETQAGDAHDKGLSFHAHVEVGTPPVVEGDPLRIQQVLRNLLGNAIKFTESGGVEVRIRALASPARDAEDAPAWIEFSVRDSGIGIPAEMLERIFAPFSQADTSTTRRYGGSGLGLTICQRLAEQMGGKIEVESTPRKGSLFRFSLPVRIAETPVDLADHFGSGDGYPAERLNQLRGRRILLVEDNEFNQAVALELLEQAGLRTDLADSGRAAIEQVGKASYELVLMDLHMPEMDGFEASQRIRRLPGKEELPIIALTANAMEGIQQRCEAAGMNALVIKPINPAELYETLLRWIQPRSHALEDGEIAANLEGDGATTSPSQPQASATGPRALGKEKLAQLFVAHYHDFPQQLRKALAEDPGQAVLLAHNMKSASGSLSATTLYQLASELETLLLGARNAQVPAALIEALEREHRVCMNKLQGS